MYNRYVYPFIAHQDRNKGITRLDQSADRIAASLAGSKRFGYDSHQSVAEKAYSLAEAVIVEGNKRKEAA